MRLSVRSVETPPAIIERTPGVRILARHGDVLVRFFVAILLVGAWFQTVTSVRAYLLRPADLGNDASNYYAAAVRIADGQQLYELSPGDRPVPEDRPPYYSVPFLSPPPVAVLWLPLALLPAAMAMNVWAYGGAALATSVTGWIVAGLPPRRLPLTALLAFGWGTLVWAGNVNAFLLPLIAGVWVFSEERSGRPSHVIAGAMAGIAALIKLTPVVLIWWLVVRRRFVAAAAAAATVALGGAITGLVAGPASFREYLTISGATAATGATPLSIAGLLHLFGVPGAVAAVGSIVGLVATAGAALALRDRPVASFGCAVLGLVIASPVVRVESFSMLIGALVPWHLGSPLAARWWPVKVPVTRLVRPAAILFGLSLAVVVMAQSALAGSSSIAIRNETSAPVVVRFFDFGSNGSFGFEIGPNHESAAWHAEAGSFNGEIIAFNDACRAIGYADFPGDATLVIRPGEHGPTLSVDPLTATAADDADLRLLDYSHACARETLDAAEARAD